MPAAALLADDDDVRRTRSGIKKSRGGHRLARRAASRRSHVEIEPPITVRGLSEAIGVKANDLIRKLMDMNQLVTINASLDDELAVMLAMEFGIELESFTTAPPKTICSTPSLPPVRRKISCFGPR